MDSYFAHWAFLFGLHSKLELYYSQFHPWLFAFSIYRHVWITLGSKIKAVSIHLECLPKRLVGYELFLINFSEESIGWRNHIEKLFTPLSDPSFLEDLPSSNLYQLIFRQEDRHILALSIFLLMLQIIHKLIYINRLNVSMQWDSIWRHVFQFLRHSSGIVAHFQ